MKQLKKFLSTIMVIIILSSSLLNTTTANAAENASSTNKHHTPKVCKDDWKQTKNGEYPINPESSEWKDMSYREALDACNMPEDYAKSLTTQELVKFASNYPLISEIYAFDSMELALTQIMKKSNVFAELLSRDDYIDKMLEEYTNIDCDYESLNNTGSLYESGCNKKLFFDAYFGVNYDSIPNDKMQKFVKEYDKKFGEMPNDMKANEMSSTFYQGIMETKGSIPNEALSKNFKAYTILNNICNELSFTKTSSTRVRLDNLAYYYEGYEIINGSKVYCYLFDSDDYSSSSVKAFFDNKFLKEHPTYTLTRSASKKYNCHSYAWYSRSSINTRWIYYPYPVYSNTNYYTKWYVPMASPGEGARVLFFSDDELLHSAVMISTRECKSKIGSLGVYQTTVDELKSLYGANRIEIYLPN